MQTAEMAILFWKEVEVLGRKKKRADRDDESMEEEKVSVSLSDDALTFPFSLGLELRDIFLLAHAR